MGNTQETNYNMKGKIVVVTGANSGIGKETARGLARWGAHVILGCRSLERGKSAIDEIKSELPDASLELIQIDLMDWDSIKNFITELKAKYQHIDILINNAAVVQTKYLKSNHNYEIMLTVNYLGQVILTEYSLELLEKAPEANGRPRIVMVASNAHTMLGTLDLKDFELDPSKVGTELGIVEFMTHYARSKLCLLLYTMLLNKKLRKRNSRILLYSVDPGFTDTPFGSGGEERFYAGLVRGIQSLVAKTPTEGAAPSLYCACDPVLEDESKSGLYFDGIDKQSNLSETSKDLSLAKTLWKWTLSALEPYLPKNPN